MPLTDISTFSDAKIAVIDSGSGAARELTDLLHEAGYRDVTASGQCELPLQESLTARETDLLVLDLRGLEREGIDLISLVRRRASSEDFLPILAVGPFDAARLSVKALQAGASEYVEWPLDRADFLSRTHVLLEIRSVCNRLRESKHAAEETLRRRTRECQESHLELLERLSRVAELKDDPSGGHPGRVGRLAGLIAQELMLPAEETRCLLRAAPLHDLGNVGIPDQLVQQEGNFTEEQRRQMRQHAQLGAYLLHGAENAVLQMAEVIALNHHERWDGFGYPQGLSHTEIPAPARIVAVADAFDAMTHPNQYKEPCSISAALDEIKREAGWQFDPEVVSALIRVYERQPSMLTIAPRARRVAG